MKLSEKIATLQNHLKLSREWLWIVGELQELGVQATQLEAEIEALQEYKDAIEGWMWKYVGTDRTTRCCVCGGKYPRHDDVCSLANALPKGEDDE